MLIHQLTSPKVWMIEMNDGALIFAMPDVSTLAIRVHTY